MGSVRGRNKGPAGQAEALAWGSRSMMTAGWPACWKATAVLTVSVVLPAPPFWEMKASVCMHVRMQEAWGCVKRTMRVLRFQVASWGERADWRGVPGRGVELGSPGSLFSGLYRLPMGVAVSPQWHSVCRGASVAFWG